MEIHFEINDQCMLKCRHCSSLASEIGGNMKYSQLDMIRFLKSISERKDVFLTGGEPLLYLDLEAMLGNLHVQTSDLNLGLFTTGIVKRFKQAEAISEEHAEKLAACGLKVCYLSVYSHMACEHDWMTGLPGSFRLLNESIKHLQLAGIEIRFNSVVTRRNLGSYKEIIDLAERMDATEVRILKLIRHGRANDCWAELGVTEEQYRTVILDAVNRINKIKITASGAIDILPCRYTCNTQSCPAGNDLVYITVTGEVFPCASVKRKNEYRIGYISDRNINEKICLFHAKSDGSMYCKGEKHLKNECKKKI